MKKLITTLLSAYLLVILPYASYAKTEDYGGTTLGSCDYMDDDGNLSDTTFTSPFNFSFYDDNKNVEKLIIKPLANDNIAIFHPNMFTDEGVDINFTFVYYNPITKDLYSFGNGSDKKYSSDYVVDENMPVRLLPGSYIKMVKNDGFFTGSDDNIKVDFIFNGEKNIAKLAKNDGGDYRIDEENCNLYFDYELFFENIDMHLNIEIPVKKILPGQTVSNRNGVDVIVAPENSSNLNMPVVDKAYAEITVNKDGILFHPWRTQTALQTGSGEDIDSVPEEEVVEKKPTKYGLTSYGFEMPEEGAFKGISTSTSLEETIVGITNFILGFVSVIAVLVLIYGGYLWIMDAGEDQMAEKSRKVIAGAIIGILIIISAYTIINTIIGMEDAYPEGCELVLDSSGNVVSGELDCGDGATNAMIGAGVSGIMNMF